MDEAPRAGFARIFRGPAFTPVSPTEVAVLDDHLFCVDPAGTVARVLAADDPEAVELLAHHRAAGTLTEAAPGQYFLPGFVDLHVHAPQWPQLGRALDRPLGDWLMNYTFPLEARYADPVFARQVYTQLVENLLRQGTTTAMYFATVHTQASVVLAEICADRGQRALVGKVTMDDRSSNPDFYWDADTASALDGVVEFIERVHGLGSGGLVLPVVTPRFIPSCTDRALAGLGEIAARYGVHVQSHCSESDWEHQCAFDRYGRSDAESLDGFGLLTGRSVMAHCVHLSDRDAELFARSGTAIAHCPVSNAFFADAVLPLRRRLDEGLEIGLGTDISGGFAPSVRTALREALVQSRTLDHGADPGRPAPERGTHDGHIVLEEAFWLATAGGGEALSLPIGRLAQGYAWDAQLVDTTAAGGLPLFDVRDSRDVLDAILLVSGAEHIAGVWVAGRRVIGD
ncbi:guanine deaminase [Brooklawnia cerclae]|uniref:Guanine deaminase n=1 Tax=Brooklawnia cerclae TaxID=349934 RepID=A0ABX0SH11_9ACTN|nr:guanine deaminase [Brooklawnia cerclae]NIH57692.1 guanine deaminase [Brooklawnia cerclae]